MDLIKRKKIFGDRIPGKPLMLIEEKNGVMIDIIGISITDYDLLDPEWQAVFFTNPSTPVVFADFAALWAAVSAVGSLNANYVIGVEDIGVAIYAIGTSERTLSKAYRYFGMTYGFDYTFPFILG